MSASVPPKNSIPFSSQFPANKRSRFSLPADAYPLTVDCCPHDRDIVAVGCESGLVVVYNTRDLGSVVHRLSAHETDVVSLSWCPAPHNVLGDEARNDMRAYLLASGAQDRSVHVWRAGSDGRRELTIDLPHEQLTTDGNRSKVIIINTISFIFNYIIRQIEKI